MTEKEIKKEIIKELTASSNCDLCKKLGIYNNCKETSCNEFLADFFQKIIEIKKMEK